MKTLEMSVLRHEKPRNVQFPVMKNLEMTVLRHENSRNVRFYVWTNLEMVGFTSLKT